jgi:uncharacterized membrane protein
MASSISAVSSLRFGWKTFKARPWLFVGTIIIYAAVQFVLLAVEKTLGDAAQFLMVFINLGVGTVLAVGLMSLYLKAHDNIHTVSFKDMWNLEPFWRYLVTSIIIAIMVIAGIFALVVPGIILALAFSMAPYLVIEKKMWTQKALKKSWQMTKGHWLELLLLGIAMAVINFLGAFLLLVGLLVTAPVSMLAMAHVYRRLSHHEEGHAS